jgi:hypothetical protein
MQKPQDQKPIYLALNNNIVFLLCKEKHRITTLSPINFQMIFGSYEEYDFTMLSKQIVSAIKGKTITTLPNP